MTARELPELPRPVAWRVCWKRPGESAVCNLFDREPESRPGIDHCIEVTPLYTSPRVSEGMVWPPGVLSLDRTLNILSKHNKWRRGGKGEQTDPRMLGLALDAVIEHLAALAQRGKE